MKQSHSVSYLSLVSTILPTLFNISAHDIIFENSKLFSHKFCSIKQVALYPVQMHLYHLSSIECKIRIYNTCWGVRFKLLRTLGWIATGEWNPYLTILWLTVCVTITELRSSTMPTYNLQKIVTSFTVFFLLRARKLLQLLTSICVVCSIQYLSTLTTKVQCWYHGYAYFCVPVLGLQYTVLLWYIFSQTMFIALTLKFVSLYFLHFFSTKHISSLKEKRGIRNDKKTFIQ